MWRGCSHAPHPRQHPDRVALARRPLRHPVFRALHHQEGILSARQSGATDRALALIGKPRPGGGTHTAYSAAKVAGISLPTIYRALARLRKLKPA